MVVFYKTRSKWKIQWFCEAILHEHIAAAARLKIIANCPQPLTSRVASLVYFRFQICFPVKLIKSENPALFQTGFFSVNKNTVFGRPDPMFSPFGERNGWKCQFQYKIRSAAQKSHRDLSSIFTNLFFWELRNRKAIIAWLISLFCPWLNFIHIPTKAIYEPLVVCIYDAKAATFGYYNLVNNRRISNKLSSILLKLILLHFTCIRWT